MKSSSSEEVITWTTSQVVLATIFVVCVFLTFWLLYSLRMVVFLLFVAIVLGTAIRPSVDWLHRHGVSRALGVILIYLLIAALLAGFGALMFPLLADQATEISRSLPQYYEDIRNALIGSGNRLLQNVGWRLPTQISFFRQTPDTAEMLGQAGQTLLYANLVFRGILGMLVVFLLAYYWTQEGSLVIRSFLRLVPTSRRKNLREFLLLAETKLGGYIRGQGLLSVAVALAAFIAYALIGLPYTLVLAIFAGIMELVPIFGPALGAIPALLVALSIDPGKALWVVIATIVIQMLENTVLVPRIMKYSMGVNPIIVLLSLIAFSSVFGFMGAILALPLAAMIQLLVSRVVLMAAEEARRSQVREREMQALLRDGQELMETIEEMSKPEEPLSNVPASDREEIHAITDELNQLLARLKKEGEAI
jgi:predicted PurR-regulated permease PerM